MSVLIAIPARYASTRYPGKPLVPLTGATGKPMTLIERSWRAAMSVSGVDRVVVATDDDRIRAAAEGFGAEVVMTSESCANGTERCAEAHDRLGGGYEIVVNLHGDAPLTPHWFIEDLVNGLRAAPEAGVATPVLRCDGRSVNGFLEDRANGRVGGGDEVDQSVVWGDRGGDEDDGGNAGYQPKHRNEQQPPVRPKLGDDLFAL